MSERSNQQDSPSLDYRAAGVDIDAGNRLVQRIRSAVESTRRPEVLGGIGGFGGLFALPQGRYANPVLVSGTDGVGTKLKLAAALGLHNGVGIDLVAMCVNDILVQGAEPLFFLDYYATGSLDLETAATVIEGIAEGCRQAGCALIGGESAEMPGMYASGDYDLAGFCVGIVERDRLIDGSRVGAGDVLVGLASSGPHSNGYSLIRRILETRGTDPSTTLGDATLGEALMRPTRIYVDALLPLVGEAGLHALAHITGGGITENLPRVLPPGHEAVVDTKRWPRPEVFDWIRRTGRIDEMEMLKTFNCGIGMIAVVSGEAIDRVRTRVEDCGIDSWILGRVTPRDGPSRVRYE
ncbi:MAG: phosphoribosylformylglycinamidine cyclo-ligase [Gammaproteobacteria bacterium]|jgi:phosphoribosylformylglycinamidine cyclo-ligase|nr:phosphoribosylformylglycinamidine cyclo-ligase [Gammaproteobacteria bacterium]